MAIDNIVKQEIELIPQVMNAKRKFGVSELTELYSEKGYHLFEELWNPYLSERISCPFPKRKSFFSSVKDSLFCAMKSKENKLNIDGMSYEETLTYVDIAYDVVASLDHMARLKGCSSVVEVRPYSIFNIDLDVADEKNIRIMRSTLKPEYIQPIDLKEVPYMKVKEFVDKTAAFYVESHGLLSDVFFKSF